MKHQYTRASIILTLAALTVFAAGFVAGIEITRHYMRPPEGRKRIICMINI